MKPRILHTISKIFRQIIITDRFACGPLSVPENQKSFSFPHAVNLTRQAFEKGRWPYNRVCHAGRNQYPFERQLGMLKRQQRFLQTIG